MSVPETEKADEEVADGWEYFVISAAAVALLATVAFVGALVIDPWNNWLAVFFPGFFLFLAALGVAWILYLVAPKGQRSTVVGMLTFALLILLSIPTGLIAGLLVLLQLLMNGS